MSVGAWEWWLMSGLCCHTSALATRACQTPSTTKARHSTAPTSTTMPAHLHQLWAEVLLQESLDRHLCAPPQPLVHLTIATYADALPQGDLRRVNLPGSMTAKAHGGRAWVRRLRLLVVLRLLLLMVLLPLLVVLLLLLVVLRLLLLVVVRLLLLLDLAVLRLLLLVVLCRLLVLLLCHQRASTQCRLQAAPF